VSFAGLVAVMRLAEDAGLHELVAERVHLGTHTTAGATRRDHPYAPSRHCTVTRTSRPAADSGPTPRPLLEFFRRNPRMIMR
jgi:hypothetical protein